MARSTEQTKSIIVPPGFLADEELIKLIDEVQAEPAGDPSWEFELLTEESGPESITVLMSHWTFDSRTWEFGVEIIDESQMRQCQTTTITFRRPKSDREFVRDLAETGMQTAAHEFLEFFRFRGLIFHDPHEHGDPEIRLPHGR